jgi:ribosomal protein S27AE
MVAAIWQMPKPCPRCGAIRTDSVRHGVLYWGAWALGYRLRQCSRCRFPRLFRRHNHNRPESETAFTAENTSPNVGTAERKMQEPVMDEQEPKRDAPTDPKQIPVTRDRYCCPRCGSTFYRRSRRSLMERILMRPRMARCKTCAFRFPYPTR